MEERFVADDMPWKNCVSLSVDNTNAMIGIRNSVASRFLGKNNETCIAGCPCHLAHIAAGHANDGFCNYINLNIEDVCVDAFYWLIKAQNVKTSWLRSEISICSQISVRTLAFIRLLFGTIS